jgi:hypothetical protein
MKRKTSYGEKKELFVAFWEHPAHKLIMWGIKIP